MGMIQDTSSVYTVKNRILDSKIHTFIEYVEDRMGLQLIRDKELKESLYVHIERALTRIRSGMCISNPLIEDVKKDYEELFGIIREGADRIFQDDFFPDDEIGYLVLYFAVSLDKVMKRSFRILVVCSGGMGFQNARPPGRTGNSGNMREQRGIAGRVRSGKSGRV